MSKSSDKGQVQGMNSQNFSSENKTSSNDTRQNMGAVGAMDSKIMPNAGAPKRDYQDDVKNPGANKAFKQMHKGKGNSDAE